MAYKREKEAKDKESGKKFKEKPKQEERINIGKLNELIDLLSKLISNAPGNPHQDAYFSKYNLIYSFTNAEIIGLINNSNERRATDEPIFLFGFS